MSRSIVPDREQRAAISHVASHLLVVAGAGTGKTAVLTHRVAHLVGVVGVDPQRVVAVTFTNRAAEELRTRLVKLLGSRSAAQVTVATFHAFGAKLLRQHGTVVGLPVKFSILSPANQRDQLTLLVRGHEKHFAQLGLAGSSSDLVCNLLAEISYAKQRALTPDALAAKATSALQEAVVEFYRRYEQTLAELRAVDLDDTVARAVHLLRDHRVVRRQVREEHTHVLVDEAQDLNAAQYALLRQLAPRRGHLTLVGDDDQAVYGWRGGDVRLLRVFEEDYDATIITLGTNHRCRGPIVQAAAQVVAGCTNRIPKTLRAKREDGPAVRVITARDADHEARFVVRQLQRLLSEGNVRTTAILVRRHEQAIPFIRALGEANIAHTVAGREDRLVGAALLQLRLLLQRDDASVLGALAVAPWKLDGDLRGRILDHAREQKLSVWRVLASGTLPPRARASTRDAVAAFVAFVRELRKAARLKTNRLVDLIDLIAAQLGARTNSSSDTPLGALAQRVAMYEAQNPGVKLRAVLDEITMTGTATATPAVPSAVAVLTMHAAKGLGFDAVFVTGLEEGLVPGDGDPGELDEGRRLTYVACTRAKRHLVVSWAARRQVHGQGFLRTPSPFIAELLRTR